MIRWSFVYHILDAWDGNAPDPWTSEYSRGMYETAVAMLGLGGEPDTEGAIRALWEDVKREKARRAKYGIIL